MNKQKYSSINIEHSQKGIVLIVGLVVVLLMSIIALSAIRGSGLQEAMVGNMRDRNIAFQAAESGLSVGEETVNRNIVTVLPLCDGTVHDQVKCWDDLQETSPEDSVNYFNDSDFGQNGVLTALGITPAYSQPVYVLEELRTFLPNDGSEISEPGAFKYAPYRVTSKGVGFTKESEVIVQSSYITIP